MLSHAIVPLFWIDALAEPTQGEGSAPQRNDPRGRSATGFLIRVKNSVLWITAGHVLRQIEEDPPKVGRRIIKFALADGLHPSAINNDPVPFRFADLPRFRIENEEYGLDYAAIPIPRHEWRLLRANGTEAIPYRLWGAPNHRFDLLCLAGVPVSHRSVELSRRPSGGNFAFSLGCPLLPLLPMDEPPYCLRKGSPRVYGRILGLGQSDDASIPPLTDINGLSGGPVFGIRLQGDVMSWRLLGVQSEWAPESQVIAACPIRPFAREVVRRLDAWRSGTIGDSVDSFQTRTRLS